MIFTRESGQQEQNLDTNALQAFLMVAKNGSFSLAAERLFLTQPAVSKRIAALESELDTKLFDRIGRKIALTEAGRTLLPRAQRVIIELEDSKRAVSKLSGKIEGRLSIGTSHHIGLHRLPPVLRTFTHNHADVELDLQFMDSEQACAAVVQGDLELGIVTLPLDQIDKLVMVQVWQDPLCVVVGKNHALATTKKVSAKTLSLCPAILPARGTYTREVLERVFAPLGISLNVSLSTNYLETIKMMVNIGLGWSILPVSMVNKKDDRIINVTGLNFQRTLGVVYHADRTLSNAASAMIRLLT